MSLAENKEIMAILIKEAVKEKFDKGIDDKIEEKYSKKSKMKESDEEEDEDEDKEKLAESEDDEDEDDEDEDDEDEDEDDEDEDEDDEDEDEDEKVNEAFSVEFAKKDHKKGDKAGTTKIKSHAELVKMANTGEYSWFMVTKSNGDETEYTVDFEGKRPKLVEM
ncbi:hypothetical protein [Alishewanella phage vB_AspM_Slickus01]|nr:hypothetical protein [Alishewanella phage vB_AspM_Slickus01]